jgi:hypothetical protein
MADFSQEKKYNYNWESSKFKGVLFEGNKISSLVNDVGYITSAGSIASASYAISASYAQTASYYGGSIVSASYSSTASYVNPLRQNVQITGSLIVSSSNTIIVIGPMMITGSLLVSGSTTQIGNNTLIGNTTLTGSISVSGSQTFVGNQYLTGSFIVSGSTTQIGNNTLTGNTSLTGSIVISGSTTNKIIGNTDITGSLSVIGDINVVSGSGFYRWGNKLFNYAQFAETSSLPITANVSGSFLLPTTYFNEGIYITSGSRITFQNTGLYNIQFSAVVDQGAGKPQLSIWFKKNGLNIDNSNTIASLQANSTALLAWNFAYPFNTGEYVEMWYHTTTTNTTLAYHAAANGFPASPSLIVTVTQIA